LTLLGNENLRELRIDTVLIDDKNTTIEDEFKQITEKSPNLTKIRYIF